MENLITFEAPQKPQGTHKKNMLIAAIRGEMNRAIAILEENLNRCGDKSDPEGLETKDRIEKIKAAADQLGNLSIQDLNHLRNIYQLPIAGNSHESIERN